VVDDPEGPHAETGNRRALILAAYARIASDGFEGIRTRDVAADAGVNIGTLHYYFPGKEDLIRAAVRHTTAKFAATLSREGTPVEQLRSHLEGLRKLLKTDQTLFAVSSEIALRAARDPAIAEVVGQGERGWQTYLEDLVSRGVEQGSLDPGLESEGVAAVLVSAIKGLSMPTVGSARAERIDRTIDQLERWLGLPSGPDPRES
jgi:AcrR family transcriptional regulator